MYLYAKACLFLSPLLVVPVLGCGNSEPVGTVTGTAAFQGEPLPAGNRVFFEDKANGILAAAVVKEEGKYRLSYKRSAGIPPGNYTVFIGPPAKNMTESDFYALKKKVDAEYRSRGEKPPPQPDWTFPAKYYLSTTSPIRETINRGENVISINLDN